MQSKEWSSWLVVVLKLLTHQFISCDATNTAISSFTSKGYPEPPPILNVYRWLQNDTVFFECIPQRILVAGDLQLQYYDSTRTPTYIGTWPQCITICGSPIRWDRAPITSLSGNSPGDSVTYTCKNDDDSGTATLAPLPTVTSTCTEREGWTAVYPICPNMINWVDQMDISISQGFQSINRTGNCIFVTRNDGLEPYISMILSNSSLLIDVNYVEITPTIYFDSSWTNGTTFTFWRDSSHIESVNGTLSKSNYTADTFSMTFESYVRAVNEIRITSFISDSISGCAIKVNGHLTETGCTDVVIPPHKTRVQEIISPYSAVLKCDDRFTYIGGNPEVTCTYERMWDFGSYYAIQCSDRVNRAIGSKFQVGIIKPFHSIGKGFNGTIYEEGISLENQIEDITLTLEFENMIAIERVVVECDGNRKVTDVKVSESSDFNTFKSCTKKTSLSYMDTSVYLCMQHPLGTYISIDIETTGNVNAVRASTWNISHIVVIGDEVKNDVVLECYNWEDGRDYQGHQNISSTGASCLHWADHQQYNDVMSFSDKTLEEAKNYCRNPDPTNRNRPFCLTAEGLQHCLVPKCTSVCTKNGVGDDYRGHLSVTASGMDCVAWDGGDGDIPFVRDHEFSVGTVKDASNYCRNPALSQSMPWCYTATSHPLGPEFCFIPACPDTTMSRIIHQPDYETMNKSITANNPNALRCLIYNDGNGQLVELKSDILNERCQTETHIYMMCLSINSTFEPWLTSWHYSNITCPELPETTTFTAVTNITEISTSSTNYKSISTSTAPLCSCPVGGNTTLSESELQEVLQSIKRELTLDKNELSSTKRAKTSADDQRASAVTTGYVGVAAMAFISSLIIVPDLISIMAHFRMHRE